MDNGEVYTRNVNKANANGTTLKVNLPDEVKKDLNLKDKDIVIFKKENNKINISRLEV